MSTSSANYSSSHSIMIQGTSSDAGKSTVVAGLCRILYRRGHKVAPFKPQNMALNSAVTVDGKEIGRAQAYQAQAAIVPAHSDMNPVLIKPCSDTGAQIIINGEPYASMDAQQYHQFKPQALTHVMRAYQRLSNQYSHIVIEGAGSPAEINLRDNDIANMGFAESADCPVVLVGDIDRGGVFAQFLGTLECLSHSERARITGFIINRFRGDPSLLTPGIEWLEKRTNKPVFGVIPYLPGIRVAAEDAIDTQQQQPQADDTKLNVAIPVLPHISNHTDFDALRLHPQVNLIFVGPGQRIAPADLVIIPGSKTVRQDLQFLREQQWDHDINRHLRYGGKLIGICGGFQMLGNSIDDPLGVEGEPGQSTGLGFLSMHTELQPNKILRQASGKLRLTSTPVSGYEIHMGITRYTGKEKSFIESDDNNAAVAGLLSIDNQVAGTYLHGLFDTPQACTALLEWAGLSSAIDINPQQHLEDTINDIADCMEQHLDIETLLAACQSYHLKQSALQLSL